MNTQKISDIKTAIENHPIIFFLGTVVVSFLSGFGTYKAILETARLDVVPKYEILQLKNEIKKLKVENGNLLKQNEQIAVAIQKYENENGRLKKRLVFLSDKKDLGSENLGNQDSLKQKKLIPGKFYNVTLHLPSHMAGSEIFVDGTPATIVKDRHLLITIKVPVKIDPIEIIVKKGGNVCSIRQLVDTNNEKLYPCRS